jgi:predicted nucleotidyltransferase
LKTIADYTAEKRRIAERTATEILRLLSPDRILLFGSVARGEAREMSDIDLLIIGNSKKTFKERMNTLYSDIERDEEVDMLWYTPSEIERMRQSSSFLRSALKEAITLYE